MAESAITETEESPRPAAGVPLRMLIGIVLGVAVLVGGGSVAAIMFLKPAAAPAAQSDEDLLGMEEEVVVEALEAEDGEKVGAAYVSFDAPFIVNLSPDETFPYQYLKFEVSLEVADEHKAEELGAMLPKMKSVITGIMNSVAYVEVSTSRGQAKFQRRITEELNAALHHAEGEGEAEDPIYNTYFTTLVAQ